MIEDKYKVAVVIPCYKVSGHISTVILSLPEFIDHIIVVDDACPESSGKIAQAIENDKITVITHEQNQGVGGAVISGYKKAIELNCDFAVKVDGDGQMDPSYIGSLVKPLALGKADFSKGNRFRDFQALKAMPALRLIGNNALSFLEKGYSGYWDIMDPTNGFTAITVSMLKKLNLSKIAKDYFFESNMLLALYLQNAIIVDIQMPAIYGNEESSLKIGNTLLGFPPKLLCGLFRRIVLRYFIYDFNMASVYLLIGIPLLLFGVIFGLVHWIDSFKNGIANTTGTVMLAVLPIILSIEMLLQAINIDISNTPKRNPDVNLLE